jgi:hypothetical protein
MPDQFDAPQSVAASAEQLPPAIRELHRAVLRGFRDSGHVHRDDLHPTAAALGVDLDNALHLDNHPELHGHIVEQADAIALADCAFRPLLAS